MNTTQPIVFLTGQNGMLGQYLTQSLSDKYCIIGLQRNTTITDKPSWNYQHMINKLGIKAPDAVIHLAGAGIANKRWNTKYKNTIHDSRVFGTQSLIDDMLQQTNLPRTFLCASAIGYYGHRPGAYLTESSSPGTNFVASVAQHWELSCQKLQTTDCRVVNLRFGMILSHLGGALKDMVLPFKLGLGGRLGKGLQQYSWISIADAKNAIQFILQHSEIESAVNLTTPHPVSNNEFTSTLARVLKRPAWFHMPAFMVRFIFGEMANELLLADAHVLPEKLLTAGFEFDHAKLSTALKDQLT